MKANTFPRTSQEEGIIPRHQHPKVIFCLNYFLINETLYSMSVREVNEILEKLELIDMWRRVNRDKKEYTFFSAALSTFTKIDHVLVHRNMAKNAKEEK